MTPWRYSGWALSLLLLQGCPSTPASHDPLDSEDTSSLSDVVDRADGTDTASLWDADPPLSPECTTDDDCPNNQDDICLETGCELKTGMCIVRPVSDATLCDDGDPCTTNAYCEEGLCSAGTPVACDDSDPCNGVEICNSTTGECEALSAPFCGDGILQMECGETCDDGNTLLLDGCDDACQEEALLCEDDLSCNDSNPCTLDQCEPFVGCSHPPSTEPCDDGDACTTDDICNQGSCAGGAPLLCDDGWPCTLDACDNLVGCVATPVHTNCDDSSLCTEDSCNPDAGCEYTPVENGLICNPANSCFHASTCIEGLCAAGLPVDCEDGNGCTENDCDLLTGCTTTPLNGDECEDGNPCTEEDLCVEGSCEGTGIPLEICFGGKSVICDLTGLAGEEVSCPLRLAQSEQDDKIVTALQFAMSFDATAIELVNFFDWICFNEDACFELAVSGPTALPLSSGHSLTMAPLTASGWQPNTCETTNDCANDNPCVEGTCSNSGGFGAVVMAHFNNPTIALTEAFLNPDGSVSGDPTIVEAHFILLKDAPISVPVSIEDPLGSDNVFETVYLQNENGILTTVSWPDTP